MVLILKKIVKIIFSSILIVVLALIFYKIVDRKEIEIIHENIDYDIFYKGIKDAKSFELSENGDLYIAFNNYIKIIDEKNGKEKILRNENFNIYDICLYEEKLIIATGHKVLEYNEKNNKFEELIVDIPNYTLNKETKLLLNKDKLYVSVGSNTNSGIVDKPNGEKDIASFQWELTGENYGEKQTGAFLDYEIASYEGQIILEEKISNGSILCYDLKERKYTTYATGIRNIKGFDFDSEGSLKAIIGGIEDSGVRPIKDDKDYIYEIKEKSWYGWPDYSGGDFISSPRFSDGVSITKPVINNPPTKSPHGPIYQNNTINSLNGLCIDDKGLVLEKNEVVFADNNEGSVYKLNNRIKSKLISLKEGSYIEKIMCYNNGIYILDSGNGELYRVENREKILLNLPIRIWIFSIVFILLIILLFTLKFKDEKYYKR